MLGHRRAPRDISFTPCHGGEPCPGRAHPGGEVEAQSGSVASQDEPSLGTWHEVTGRGLASQSSKARLVQADQHEHWFSIGL